MKNFDLLHYSNILLIAGAGRNVGKTTLACDIINTLSKKFDAIGVKISPHIHDQKGSSEVIFQNENFVIYEEKSNSEKDSSRMLKAGAKHVYYIQTEQEYYEDAIKILEPFIINKPVICESGGLHQVIKPGLFFFVYRDNNIPENKKDHLKYDPIILNLFNPKSDFRIENIRFENQQFSYQL